MPGRLYVGTSGFAFPEWKGSFYPSSIKAADMLAFYATRLGSVEINLTFRRFPTEKLMDSWREKVPPGFAFTLKAHQRITHRKKLQDVDREVLDFTDRARRLGDRLGVILFQCPPYLRFDAGILREFLALLPTDVRCAMEFRHASFDTDEVRSMLAERGVAWCVSDTGQRPVLHRTAPFVYVRMRDEEIGDAGLHVWVDALREVQKEHDAFVYFKHEGLGGVEAVRFLELVGQASGEDVLKLS